MLVATFTLVAGWIAYLLVVSLCAAALVVVDKKLAERGARRVPERTLLLTALVGGSPGLIVAMITMRHKVRKASFLAKLVVVIALQAFVVWVFVPR